MSTKQIVKEFKDTLLPGILNSYSIIFFLNNRFMALVLMAVTFFNFYAGLSGFIAVLISLLIGKSMHLDETALRKGVYSFNALLTGIGMGTFFDPGVVFFSLLIIATLLCLFLSVTLGGWLYKYNLPHLSIPFVISIWFIMLPASHFENLGLTQRNIYWLNEMYAMGGSPLVNMFQFIDSMQINKLLDIYLRSLSSIFFQSNLISGLLIAIALLVSSRIFFSLSVVGFLAAYLFAQFTGSETASMTYYNIGANYMMVAFAIGGFFIIPSKQSYLWTILLVPLTSLVLLFFYKLLNYIQLPVFSLPFSFVVILFVYFLQHRSIAKSLILTPYQNYSPEVNLYTYNNNKDRFARFLYKPFQLPFWGEWTVTQGYDDEYTHLGEWGKALDFMIKDTNGLTYRSTGQKCEDYHCFSKPVIAIADGVVETVVDNIEDNEIGKINTLNNWGNTVVIHHYNGVYSQVSHLKKGSVKVKAGEFVNAGDIIAQCGNSGRSPEPHLHFQIQYLPVVGAASKEYPIAFFYSRDNEKISLHQYSIPAKNAIVSNVTHLQLLKKSFNILPENQLRFKYLNTKGQEITEEWKAYTDAYNYKYLYCKETGDVAYYVNDGFMFYFTSYYGRKKSLLYYFYLSANKVFLCNNEATEITDSISLNYVTNNKLLIWLNDFISPFNNLVVARYTSDTKMPKNRIENDFVTIKSEITLQTPGKKRKISTCLITLTDCGIHEIKFKSGKTLIHATCIK